MSYDEETEELMELARLAEIRDAEPQIPSNGRLTRPRTREGIERNWWRVTHQDTEIPTPAELVKLEHLAAVRGEEIPTCIDSRLARSCVIRGIRLHYSFATSDAVTSLCAADATFTRARNARLIMSNVIPSKEDMPLDIDTQESRLPYCIWYPDLATENTYRQLFAEFPCLRYQIGRACAVAGYTELYNELDLLPDVAIAEEARESSAAESRVIYDRIMSAEIRYRVMDDYSRRVNVSQPEGPAFLNGDTEICRQLAVRRGVPLDHSDFNLLPCLCIEEDDHMDTKTINRQTSAICHLSYDEAALLYTPLPADLPTVKKELLIHMAARQGNIERYTRLCRPLPLGELEFQCLLYGIYHDTMFARFWRSEIDAGSARLQRMSNGQLDEMKRAISARRIQVGDTQEFDLGWTAGEPLPFMIWWPKRPEEQVLLHLARIAPVAMYEAIAIAAIIYDYSSIFRLVKSSPTYHVWRAAKRSHNPLYLQEVEAIALAQEIDVQADPYPWGEGDLMNFEMDDDHGLFGVGPFGMSEVRIADPLKSLDAPYDGSQSFAGFTETQIWAKPKRIDMDFNSGNEDMG